MPEGARLRPLEIVFIALGLAMDACAVAVGCGASGQARGARAGLRLAFHFGLFQFMMPVIGWAIGVSIAHIVAAWDHWIAFALLVFVGARMIRAGFSPTVNNWTSDPSRGFTLVMLAFATSIDALAIGLSLAMLSVSIWYPSVVIGVVTVGVSMGGFQFGSALGVRFGKRMEIAGGMILCLIGLRILIAHLG
jgi:putative Mn2+ efflux pump MntP